MIKKLLLFIFSITLMSCGSSKKITTSQNSINANRTIASRSTTEYSTEVSIADKIVWTAVTYKGIPYKYGGTNRSGMDCSGLIYTSFKKRDVNIPRTSRLMYNDGFPIKLKEVKRGDLLFFRTSKSRNKVNHVGLVTSVDGNDIKFIHSTSSRGVIVTSLNETYWNRAFIKAKRVL
ncbi:C40 family peptidase [Tenacibaculum adriaticum]|nr:C40 family peptidase [Tenacibaculum adriaticum]